LLGSAPIEGRLSGVVDIPDSCATVYIPMTIFDSPITASASGPTKIGPEIGDPHAASRRSWWLSWLSFFDDDEGPLDPSWLNTVELKGVAMA